MADLHDLLVKTSRTFGLSIPFLPEPTRIAVTIAYLLFRIADTFEDADLWPGPRRVSAINDWQTLLANASVMDLGGRSRTMPCDPRSADPLATRLLSSDRLVLAWLESPPCDVPAYLELLAEVPFVLDSLASLPDETRERITPHVLRTCCGMIDYVRRIGSDGFLRVSSIDDLRNYCYIVAGIVGEMLTDLFILGWPPLAPHRAAMIIGSNRFGEALQLVNILKDSADDEKAGRVYLPHDVDLAAIYAIAHSGLQSGAEYIISLQDNGAPKGFVTFLIVPLFLGWATLDLVERHRSGAKVSREFVAAVMQSVHADFREEGPRYTAAGLRELYLTIQQLTPPGR
jgi:farnesyl-diphosphate farnesyltransferase